MKKICFITTIAGTIEAFLIDLTHYLVEKEDYDVTFICDRNESLFSYTNEHIHYIPINIKRGIGFDGLSVINQLTKIGVLFTTIFHYRINIACLIFFGIHFLFPVVIKRDFFLRKIKKNLPFWRRCHTFHKPNFGWGSMR